MRKPIVLAAAVALLTAWTSGFGAQPAQSAAASNYCKHRYNICLARCPRRLERCYRRCQSQYRACPIDRPYLGDLI
jgi:hypothetical protein